VESRKAAALAEFALLAVPEGSTTGDCGSPPADRDLGDLPLL